MIYRLENHAAVHGLLLTQSGHCRRGCYCLLTILCKFNAPPDLYLTQIKRQENKAAGSGVFR